MTVTKLAIIGAGQIGSRHLQSLAFFDGELCIQVVDPSLPSLKIAKERFLQTKGSAIVKKLSFYTDIKALEEELDLVIVATNSNIRQTVIEQLLMTKKVRFLILEKVAFQSAESFTAIHKLFMKTKVRAWVNCPLRMLDFFKQLKQQLCRSSKVDYRMSGTQIGIGCNAIHHIDLFAYLTNQTNLRLRSDFLDDQIIQSKRNGFIEFTGTLVGSTSQGSHFCFTSHKEGKAPFLLQITSEEVRAVICYETKKAWISVEATGWRWIQSEFEVPFQSQLTQKAVQQILKTGNCDLPTFDESWKLHLPLLKVLLNKYNWIFNEETGICRIT